MAGAKTTKPEFNLISARNEPAPGAFAAAIMALGERMFARANQIVVGAGTRSDDVYVVVSGRVRAAHFSSDGHDVVVRDQGAGSFFDEIAAIDQGRPSETIMCLEPCELAVIPGADFRTLVLANPESAAWFAKHLAAQIRQLTERILELSTLSARSRLHRLLLRLCDASAIVDNQAAIDPSPTHQVLATMIGSNREAVTREISYLAATGLIEQRRRRIEIKDVERLAAVARQANRESPG